jgi:hypothetical protein
MKLIKARGASPNGSPKGPTVEFPGGLPFFSKLIVSLVSAHG